MEGVESAYTYAAEAAEGGPGNQEGTIGYVYDADANTMVLEGELLFVFRGTIFATPLLLSNY